MNRMKESRLVIVCLLICIPLLTRAVDKPDTVVADVGSKAMVSGTNAVPPLVAIPPGSPPRGWGAGVAVVAATSPYHGGRPVVLPFPSLTYTGERLSVAGPRVAWCLGRAGGASVSAIATYQFAGILSRRNDSYFDGMHNPGGTVEGGVELQSFLPGGFRAQLAPKTDLLGVFDGQEVGGSLSRGIKLGNWVVSPGVGATALSRNMVDYYFGVRPEEARPDRPAYAPGSTLNWGPRLTVMCRLTERVSLVASCNYDRLGSGITGSPLIEDNYVISSMTALSYRF